MAVAESAFEEGEEGFRVASWINQSVENSKLEACSAELEKHLAEQEMKLNLLAEDVETSLEEISSDALDRIPTSIASLERAEIAASKLRSSAQQTLDRALSERSSACSTTSLIRSLHNTKIRLESASSACAHASGLSQLLSDAEHLASLSDNDPLPSDTTNARSSSSSRLVRLAELVESARESIDSLSEMEGIAESQARLASVEHQLESQAYSRAMSAMSCEESSSSQLADARNALATTNKLDVLERAYVSCKQEPLISAWNERQQVSQSGHEQQMQPLETFLLEWHSQLERSVASEKQWCRDIVPQEEGRLISALVRDVLAQTSTPLKKEAHAAAASDPELAARLHDECTRFARTLIQSIPLGHSAGSAAADSTSKRNASIAQDTARGVVELIHASMEDLRTRLADLEKAHLHRVLQPPQLKPSSNLDEAARSISSCVEEVYSQLDATFSRCLRFTAGTEAQPVLRSMDEALLQVLQRIGVLLESLTSSIPSTGQDERGVRAAFRVLSAGVKLGRRQHALEASIRSQLVDGDSILRSAVELAKRTADGNDVTPEELAASPSSLRIRNSHENKKRIEALLEQAADARFTALPRSSPKVPSVEEGVEKLVHESMLSKSRAAIDRGVTNSSSDAWEAQGAEQGISFSLSPSAYATEVGEHLLMLPQLLEDLSGEASGEQQEGNEDTSAQAVDTCTRLLKSVAESASTLLAEELMKIKRVSGHGRMQLAADAEYVANVNGALGADTPQKLLSLLELMQVEESSFEEAAASETHEKRVVNAVRAMRKEQ